MLRYVPSLPTLLRVFCSFFLSWMDVEFCQIIFLHLLRWSCGFWLLLMWCITWICIYWTVLMNLGWIPFGHSVWSFLCIVGFSFLIFCWELLNPYSSSILVCNFLFSFWYSLVLLPAWWCLYRLKSVYPLYSFG